MHSSSNAPYSLSPEQIMTLYFKDSSKVCSPERFPLDALKSFLYPQYSSCIDNLKNSYESVRISKKNGNTFYRCIGISYLEYLCRPTTPFSEFEKFYNSYINNSGYTHSRDIVISTRPNFIQFIRYLVDYKNTQQQRDKLILQYLNETLQNIECDSALINEMRCITANYLERHTGMKYFEKYSRDTLQDEILRILTIGQEGNEIIRHCLSSALEVYVKQVNLNSSPEFEIFGLISCRAPVIDLLWSDKFEILYSYGMNRVDQYNARFMEFTRYRIPDDEFRRYKENLYMVSSVYMNCGHNFESNEIVGYIRNGLVINNGEKGIQVKCPSCGVVTPAEIPHQIKNEVREMVNARILVISGVQSRQGMDSRFELNVSTVIQPAYIHQIQQKQVKDATSGLNPAKGALPLNHIGGHNPFKLPSNPSSLPLNPTPGGPSEYQNQYTTPLPLNPTPGGPSEYQNQYTTPLPLNPTPGGPSEYQDRYTTPIPLNTTPGGPSEFQNQLQSQNQTQADVAYFKHLNDLINCPIQTCGKVRIDLEALKRSFSNKEIISRIEFLMQRYDCFRRSRGDGNCYYRAVGLGYLEHLCRITTPASELISFYEKLSSNTGYFTPREINAVSKSYLMAKLYDLVQHKLKNKFALPYLEELMEDFQFDISVIYEIRCLAANYLEQNKDVPPLSYYLFEGINDDMNRILEAGKEAEGITFSVTASVLQVYIQHVPVFDSSNDDPFEPEGVERAPLLFVLYKKGHYDILYSRNVTVVDGYNLRTLRYENLQVDTNLYLEKLYYRKGQKSEHFIKPTDLGARQPLPLPISSHAVAIQPSIPPIQPQLNQGYSLISPSIPSIQPQLNQGSSLISPSMPQIQPQLKQGSSLISSSMPPIQPQLNQGYSLISPSMPPIQPQLNQGYSLISPSIPLIRPQLNQGYSLIPPSIPPIQPQLNQGYSLISPSMPPIQPPLLYKAPSIPSIQPPLLYKAPSIPLIHPPLLYKAPPASNSMSSSQLPSSKSVSISIHPKEPELTDLAIPGYGDKVTFSCGDTHNISRELKDNIESFLKKTITKYIGYIQCPKCYACSKVSKLKELIPLLDYLSLKINRKFEWIIEQPQDSINHDETNSLKQLVIDQDTEIDQERWRVTSDLTGDAQLGYNQQPIQEKEGIIMPETNSLNQLVTQKDAEIDQERLIVTYDLTENAPLGYNNQPMPEKRGIVMTVNTISGSYNKQAKVYQDKFDEEMKIDPSYISSDASSSNFYEKRKEYILKDRPTKKIKHLDSTLNSHNADYPQQESSLQLEAISCNEEEKIITQKDLQSKDEESAISYPQTEKNEISGCSESFDIEDRSKEQSKITQNKEDFKTGAEESTISYIQIEKNEIQGCSESFYTEDRSKEQSKTTQNQTGVVETEKISQLDFKSEMQECALSDIPTEKNVMPEDPLGSLNPIKISGEVSKETQNQEDLVYRIEESAVRNLHSAENVISDLESESLDTKVRKYHDIKTVLDQGYSKSDIINCASTDAALGQSEIQTQNVAEVISYEETKQMQHATGRDSGKRSREPARKTDTQMPMHLSNQEVHRTHSKEEVKRENSTDLRDLTVQPCKREKHPLEIDAEIDDKSEYSDKLMEINSRGEDSLTSQQKLHPPKEDLDMKLPVIVKPIVIRPYKRIYPIDILTTNCSYVQLSEKINSFHSFMGFGSRDNMHYLIGISYLEHLLRSTTDIQELLDYREQLGKNAGYFEDYFINYRKKYLEKLDDLIEKRKSTRSGVIGLYAYISSREFKAVVESEIRNYAAKYLSYNKNKPNTEQYMKHPFGECYNKMLDLSEKITQVDLECLTGMLKACIKIYNLDKDQLQIYGDVSSTKVFNIAIREGCYILYTNKIQVADNYDFEEQQNEPIFDEESKTQGILPETYLNCGDVIDNTKLDYLMSFVISMPKEFDILSIKCPDCKRWISLETLDELNKFILYTRRSYHPILRHTTLNCLECKQKVSVKEFCSHFPLFCYKCAFIIIKKQYVRPIEITSRDILEGKEIMESIDSHNILCDVCVSPMKVSQFMHQEDDILFICTKCCSIRKCVNCLKIVNTDEEADNPTCECIICNPCYVKLIHEDSKACPSCKIDLLVDQMIVCLKCKNQDTLKLDCGDSFCARCLLEYKPHYNFSVCPCGKALRSNIRNYLRNLAQKRRENAKIDSECKMCFRKIIGSVLMISDCGVQYCKKCLYEYMNYKLENRFINVNGIECPFCNVYLKAESLNEVLPSEISQRYRNFLNSFTEHFIRCPKCKKYTQTQVKNTQCAACSFTFCTKCLTKPHKNECNPSGIKTICNSYRNTYCLAYECPSCNMPNKYLRSITSNLKCQNPECSEVLCSSGLCYMDQVIVHGRAFHKPSCPKHNLTDISRAYNPIYCSKCKESNKQCEQPKP